MKEGTTTEIQVSDVYTLSQVNENYWLKGATVAWIDTQYIEREKLQAWILWINKYILNNKSSHK